MKLYDLERSGNCYKIRLFLSILGEQYKKIAVNTNAGENKTDEYLAINPRGLMPVLIDGENSIYDSAAILVYLASSYADKSWLPTDSLGLSTLTRWLAFEQNEVRYGLARARAATLKNPSPFAQLADLSECHRVGTIALNALEEQLQQTAWLLPGNKPTIADIACYPYVALSEEGGLSLASYPSIVRWTKEIEHLDGYVDLP